MEFNVVQIPTQQIKFFVRRARREAAYARLKRSISEVGLKTPVGVREISDRARSERRRPKGGYYKYELVYGQGRLQAFRELDIERIPAIIVDVKEEEIVGRFLAENVMRRKLGWREKVELIRHDVDYNDLSGEDIADKYCITQAHAYKYLHILTGASDKTLDRAKESDFSFAETEKLTTLPLDDQDVVIDVMEEHDLDKSALKSLVDEAIKIRANGTPLKHGLRRSLNELNDSLKKSRQRFKLRKLEFALGPQHLLTLAKDDVFMERASAAGIDLSYFVKSSGEQR